MNKLDKWKKLAEEATRIPWELSYQDNDPEFRVNLGITFKIVPGGSFDRVVNEWPDQVVTKTLNDAAFIAASREAVPVLIELLEKAILALEVKNHPLSLKFVDATLKEIREKLETK